LGDLFAFGGSAARMRPIRNPRRNRFTCASLILSHDCVDTPAAHAQPVCHDTNSVTRMKPQQSLRTPNHAGIRSGMGNSF
jgi:hypothetical protein